MMAALLSLLVFTAIVVLLFKFLPDVGKFVWRKYKIYQAAKKFPCPPRHWLWGNLNEIKNIKEFNKLTGELQGKCFVIWLGPFEPLLSVIHPETVKVILRTAEPKRLYSPNLIEPWLGEGLVFSEGRKWERNRKLLTPAFHFSVLRGYISVYNDSAETLIKKLENHRKEGESLEISQFMSLATLEIVLRCAFSSTDKIQEHGSSNLYVISSQELVRLLMHRSLRPHLQFSDFLYKLTSQGRQFFKHCAFVHKFADEVIQKRKRELESQIVSKQYPDFLDILLQARDEDDRGLTDKEIRDEVDVFMFAGHDTTASTMSFALYAFAKYPEEQEKVWQEIQEVSGNRQEITWEDLPQLKYLHLFIREVLRMYSVVPFISRALSKPYVFDGVECPRGMIISINIAALNHNQIVWTNHEEFCPERFSIEESKDRDPYAFVPFSAGPRNCIGQNFAINEVKVVLSKLLKRFKLTLDESHEMILLPEIVTKAENGIKLFLHPRN